MKRRYLLVLIDEGLGLYLMDSDQWSDFQQEIKDGRDPFEAFWSFQWSDKCPAFTEVTEMLAFCERENISVEGEAQGQEASLF